MMGRVAEKGGQMEDEAKERIKEVQTLKKTGPFVTCITNSEKEREIYKP
jgi:hypothetical protein